MRLNWLWRVWWWRLMSLRIIRTELLSNEWIISKESFRFQTSILNRLKPFNLSPKSQIKHIYLSLTITICDWPGKLRGKEIPTSGTSTMSFIYIDRLVPTSVKTFWVFSVLKTFKIFRSRRRLQVLLFNKMIKAPKDSKATIINLIWPRFSLRYPKIPWEHPKNHHLHRIHSISYQSSQ